MVNAHTHARTSVLRDKILLLPHGMCARLRRIRCDSKSITFQRGKHRRAAVARCEKNFDARLNISISTVFSKADSVASWRHGVKRRVAHRSQIIEHLKKKKKKRKCEAAAPNAHGIHACIIDFEESVAAFYRAEQTRPRARQVLVWR